MPKRDLGYEDQLTPTGINEFRQNRPILIVRDLERLGVPRNKTLACLLARGVFKWFAVRRDLIRLKTAWKARVNHALWCIRVTKRDGRSKVGYWRGYLRAIQECRAEVRALCHSPRWRAPDNDREAQRFLEWNNARIEAERKETKP